MKRHVALVAFALFGWACSLDVDEGAGTTHYNQIGRVQQAGLVHGSLGIHCTNNYENTWVGGSSYRWEICNGVWDNLSATQQFKYNLQGKQYYWHSGGDGATNSLESVDMFFSATHGGAHENDRAEWAMWNDDANPGPPTGITARSNQMSLGNESHRLSIFVPRSCAAMEFDSHFWTRWDSVFSGLRMALGSHGDIDSGSAERHFGEDFADYLNDSRSFKQAWGYAADNTTYNNQDVAMVTVGNTATQCRSRRDYMTWTNFDQYSRVTSDTWCGWYWNNI